MLIDPDGNIDDHYFTEKGKYLGDDGAVTDNVRIIPEDTWDNIKTTNQDGTETVNHYVGYANSKAHSEAELTEEASLNIFSHYNITDLPLSNSKNYESPEIGKYFMGFIKKEGVIAVDVSINNKYKLADNYNNIINEFTHENKHKLDYQSGQEIYNKSPQDLREIRAINYQMNHPSFEKTTKLYKAIVKSLKEQITPSKIK